MPKAPEKVSFIRDLYHGLLCLIIALAVLAYTNQSLMPQNTSYEVGILLSAIVIVGFMLPFIFVCMVLNFGVWLHKWARRRKFPGLLNPQGLTIVLSLVVMISMLPMLNMLVSH